MSKECQEKHNKYNEFYKNNPHTPIYWGLGIENESYLMFNKYLSTTKDFMLRRHKPERYSVNYYRNYNSDFLYHTLEQLPDEMQLPIYINSYLFQKADINGEHMTVYSKENYINKKFNGKTIDMYMKENSEIYNKLFENNMVFDGDTFEFTTFNFYNAKVKDVIKELKDIKKQFIKEINNKLVGKGIFKDEIIYPPMNHGFVRFNSNINNLGSCNNGTYHINITIPTELDSNGNIKDLKLFKSVHMNAIRAIQWLEPILICIYGTPDVLSKYNNNYSMGSLRLIMSRYIGAGTYDTEIGQSGKLLNCCTQPEWYNTLHKNSPYIPPETIGYDINYNKFQKHGIELRIFDYFPEEYLEDVINLIILVCHHSIKNHIPKPQNHNEFIYGLMASIRYGRRAQIPRQYINTLYEIFDINNNGCFGFIKKPNTILEHINYIAKQLRKRYYNKGMTKLMSPNMKSINITFPHKAIEIISHNYTESLL